MRTLVSAAASVAVLAACAGCDSAPVPADLALGGFCPVSYFTARHPVPGDAAFVSRFDGATYRLSSAEAKAAFDREPEKYVPVYGGWCAYGLAMRTRCPGDPEVFEIVDGRLHLFFRSATLDARALWLRGDRFALAARAAGYWATLRA